MHRIEEIEKALNLLDTYDGQLSKTARALGINRYTLRSWRDKRKKVCTPLEVLSLYQTCRSMLFTHCYLPIYFAHEYVNSVSIKSYLSENIYRKIINGYTH